MAETRVIWGGRSQSLSHSQQGSLRFLAAPDGLLASCTHLKKQFSYQHWSDFSCLYWCRVVFSLSFTALEWVKILSEISQWLTAVWKLRGNIWLLNFCGNSQIYQDFWVFTATDQNTGTEGHEPAESGGCMDEGSSFLKKWDCRAWEMKSRESPSIHVIHYVGIRTAEWKYEKKIQGGPRNSCRFQVGHGHALSTWAAREHRGWCCYTDKLCCHQRKRLEKLRTG